MSDPGLLRTLAAAHLERRDDAGALDACRGALRLQSHPDAWANASVAYLHSHSSGEAIAAARRAQGERRLPRRADRVRARDRARKGRRPCQRWIDAVARFNQPARALVESIMLVERHAFDPAAATRTARELERRRLVCPITRGRATRCIEYRPFLAFHECRSLRLRRHGSRDRPARFGDHGRRVGGASGGFTRQAGLDFALESAGLALGACGRLDPVVSGLPPLSPKRRRRMGTGRRRGRRGPPNARRTPAKTRESHRPRIQEASCAASSSLRFSSR